MQTGIGRTGAWFACEHEGVVPDIVATAKGLGGGLPIAGVTARADLVDRVHAGGLGGTFGGNPLSCAAALAAIETIEQDGLLARATAIGETITTRLTAMQASYPCIGDVRGRGAMIAAELVGADGITPDADLTKRVAAACHARRRAGADRRQLRQRAAAAAAAGHLRRAARRRPRRPGEGPRRSSR